MGRYRKYRSDKALRAAVEDYFAGISRIVDVMEERLTGEKDKWGHFEKEWVPVKNEKGEIIREREFVIPPTVGGLCEHLGISRQTWASYCDPDCNEKFQETTTWAREILKGYLEGQLLVRSGKDLKGVIFSLQNNYGMSEKRTVELGQKAAEAIKLTGSAERESLLRKIAEEFSGDGDRSDGDRGAGDTGETAPGESGEADYGRAEDGAGDSAVVESAQENK